MQVFKAFFQILRKNLPTAMVWVVVFLIIAAGVTMNNNDPFSFEEQQFQISVFDEDQTPESQALVVYLGNHHKLVSIEQEQDTILDMLYQERIDYAMTIKKGYAENLQAGKTDALFTHYYLDDRYVNTLLDNMLSEYVKTVLAYETSGFSCMDAISSAEAVLSEEISVNSDPFAETTGTSSYSEKLSYYFQYLPYIFLSVFIAALSTTLMALQKADIRNRTNCSCLSSGSQTLQMLLASGILILLIWLIFMVAAIGFNGGMFTGILWYAVLNSFVFLLVAAAISILVSIVVSNYNILNVLNQVIGLGMSFLCGVFVPQSMLSDGVLKAGQFLPAYWYVRANNMLAGTSGEVFQPRTFFQYLGVECLFAVALFALIFAVQKAKHDRSGISGN